MSLERYMRGCNLPRIMDNKEKLVYIVNGITGIKDEQTLREAFRRVMAVANDIGMDFSGLQKGAARPVSLWSMVRVLASERSIRTKLIVTTGCLMAMADRENIKLI